jgi:hypothetical protein
VVWNVAVQRPSEAHSTKLLPQLNLQLLGIKKNCFFTCSQHAPSVETSLLRGLRRVRKMSTSSTAALNLSYSTRKSSSKNLSPSDESPSETSLTPHSPRSVLPGRRIGQSASKLRVIISAHHPHASRNSESCARRSTTACFAKTYGLDYLDEEGGREIVYNMLRASRKKNYPHSNFQHLLLHSLTSLTTHSLTTHSLTSLTHSPPFHPNNQPNSNHAVHYPPRPLGSHRRLRHARDPLLHTRHLP